MKSKTLISGIIVITIVIGLVIMFISDPNMKDTAQRVSAVDDKNQTTITENNKAVESNAAINKHRLRDKTPSRSTNKVASSNSTGSLKAVNKSTSDSNRRVTRVSRPGHKFRMVRVEETSIPAKSELRKWSRNQWVTKVSSLKKTGQDSLAQEYIAAYNIQYPKKDLNNYLK